MQPGKPTPPTYTHTTPHTTIKHKIEKHEMPGKESRHNFLWHQQEENLAHLRYTFREDGYPEGIITRNLRKLPRTALPSDEELPTTIAPKLLLPYVQVW